MSETVVEKKARRGGRTARRAERAAPLAEELRPVRPGLSGGTFKPFTEMDIVRINEAVMEVLETIGMADAIPSCVELCTAMGATYGEDGRLRFPRALVEDVIAGANRDFTLHGFDPKHDMSPRGHQVYYGTAGAAVHTIDVENRTYRDSTVQDLYDAARIVEGLDNVHFFQRPLTTRDIVDPLDMDINTLYASLRGTTKHVGTSITTPENAEQVLKMLHLIAGGEEAWRAPLCQQFQLLCGAALEICRRCKCCSGSLRARWHAGSAFVCRAGGGDGPGVHRRGRGTGRGGSACRSCLCECDQKRCAGDFWHLAVCLGPENRRYVRWVG